MQKLQVFIEESAFGQIRPVEMDADVPISTLLDALVEALQLPQSDLFGKSLVYVLRRSLDGGVLSEEATLQSAGVQAGERFTLDSYVLDGSVAALGYSRTQRIAQMANQAGEPESLHSSVTLVDVPPLSVIDSGAFSIPQTTPPAQGRKKRGEKMTRRSLFLLSGAMLAIGAGSVGYAAYRGWTSRFINDIFHITPPAGMTMHKNVPAAGKTPAAQPTMVLPARAQTLTTFTRHTQIVRSVSWSPDGKLLASASDDRRVFVWDVNGGVQQTIMHAAAVHGVSWAPDSQRVVTGAGNVIAFYQALTGVLLARSTRVHTQMVTSVSWSAQGPQRVVSTGADSRVVVWDPVTYRPITFFRRHTSNVFTAAWSVDGQNVASSSQAGVVRVWNSSNAQELHGYYQDGNTLYRALAFATQGMQLAVGGNDGVIRLWDGIRCQKQVMNGRMGPQCVDMPQRLQAGQSAIRTLAWSPDARFLASGADDGTLTLWYPVRSQQPLFTMKFNDTIHSIQWSPDGTMLVVASGNTVRILKLM